jgi:transcription initiation factor TFIIE subunit alpha
LFPNSIIIRYRQNELKEGAQRAVGRQYYYIDYQHFCNVVKWRVAEMRRIIDSTLRNVSVPQFRPFYSLTNNEPQELDNKGYICPVCGKSYSPLDVDKLMDFSRGAFICEICHGELVDNENAESVRGSQDRMQRFNKQMQFIREGLRKSEAMILPAFVQTEVFIARLALTYCLLDLMSHCGSKTTWVMLTNKRAVNPMAD